MNDKWRDYLFLKSEIYWGDLTEEEHFEKYYFYSESVLSAIEEIKEFSEDIDTYHAVLIAGDAGSGKTSLIRCLEKKHLLPKSHIIVLTLDHNVDNSYVTQTLLDGLTGYVESISLEHNNINERYQTYLDEKKKLTTQEKLYRLLKIHEEYSRDKEFRKSVEYKNLTIFIDQIDLAGIKELEKNIREIFQILDNSKNILKLVCARHATIKLCRNNMNSLFATTFRRQIVLQPAVFSEIVNARMKECSRSYEITKENFYKKLNSARLRVIVNVSSNNVRNMIDLLSALLRKTNPETIDKDEVFMKFLLKNNYITNLNHFEVGYGIARVPLARWIFQTLFSYPRNDIKLIKLLGRSIVSSGFGEEERSLATKANIDNSIRFLIENGLIVESVYSPKEFDPTNKGSIVLRIMDLGIYDSNFPLAEPKYSKYKVDKSELG